MNFNKMLAGLSRSGMMKAKGSSLISASLTGGMAGGLAGSLMGKSGKKTGKKALKLGALAAVGGLAWKAYQSYTEQQANGRAFNRGKYSASNQDFTYHPDNMQQERFEQGVSEENTEGQMLLLRAMVAAAHADGHIDQTERMRIFDQVDAMELSDADKSSLFDEMRNPLSVEDLTVLVPCSEVAAEVYAASTLAIDLNSPESRRYLDHLAAMLCIPSSLQDSLESATYNAKFS